MRIKIISAAVSALCIMGCTGSEDYETANNIQQKISFAHPVTGAITRDGSTAYKGPLDFGYPEDEHFHVYAVRTEGKYAGNETWTSKYMDVDAVPDKNGQTNVQFWAPLNDYFWPKNPNSYITFAAFSPAVAVSDGTFAYAGTGLTISEFNMPMASGTQYDLLYSKRAFDKKQNDIIIGGTANPFFGVNIEFQHALSRLIFFVNTESGTEKVWLKKITINNVYDKANFAENVTNQATTYVADAKWTSHAYQASSSSTYTVCDNTDYPASLGGSSVLYDSNLMIPQTLPETAELLIEWEYQNGANKEQDSKKIKLKSLIDTWLPGKQYTYNVKINLDKIYFNPTVDEWTDGSPATGEVKP